MKHETAIAVAQHAQGVLPVKLLLQIATICHDTNAAYCRTIGDLSQPAWQDAETWQQESAMNGVELHWQSLLNGNEPKPEESHNNWLAEKRKDGWSYGPVKDPKRKQHPCYLPYEDLPAEQKMKDFLFIGVVTAFFRAHHPQAMADATEV